LLDPFKSRANLDERILVRMDTSEDAGVFRLDAETALVQTLDVITPIVDDPGEFGYIASLNSLSDIFAMGGKPLTAMMLLAFDPCLLSPEGASLILEGAFKALKETSCALVGGHTLEDKEIKFGLSVTGTIHPERIIANSTGRVGDFLYLTKPLGTGIASTAMKAGMLPEKTHPGFLSGMKTSNGPGCAAMVESGVSAATDVTGFGLLGHLWEMCQGAGLGAALDFNAIPLLTGIAELVEMGLVPGGAYRNRGYLAAHVTGTGVAENSLLPLFDPQTSGGLLMSIAPEKAKSLEQALENHGVSHWKIGAFTEGAMIEVKGG